MSENYDSNYFRGQGAVFFGDLDANNNPSNLVFIGDCNSAELSGSTERGKAIEKRTGKGAVAASWIKSQSYSIALAMRSIKPAHLALALQGANTVKTGATVSDESHYAQPDAFISLAHNKVSSVVVTNNTNATTYVANTDYIVHADEGMIEILSTGNISAGQEVFVDYSYATQSHIKVNPNDLEKCIVFAGINTADNNKQVRCEMYKVKLDPSVLSMINDEAADMSINGELQVASSRPAGDQLYNWKVEV